MSFINSSNTIDVVKAGVWMILATIFIDITYISDLIDIK